MLEVEGVWVVGVLWLVDEVGAEGEEVVIVVVAVVVVVVVAVAVVVAASTVTPFILTSPDLPQPHTLLPVVTVVVVVVVLVEVL